MAVLGGGISRMAARSEDSGRRPSSVTWWPRQLTSFAANVHFSAPSLRLACLSRSKTWRSRARCSSQVGEKTIISSR